MYARFMHPVIPLMYVIGEMSLYALLHRRKQLLYAMMIGLCVLVVCEKSFRDRILYDEKGQLKQNSEIGGIIDEQRYYTQPMDRNLNLIQLNEVVGNQLKVFFRGEYVRVLLRGQASLGYFAKFNECIENNGLTDAFIAKLPLIQHGRPGHEKSAPLEYLEKREVHFVFLRPPYVDDPYRFVIFNTPVGAVKAEMFFYDQKLMKDLKEHFGEAVQYTDFEQYLEEYISSLSSKSREQVQRDYEKFRIFYFQHTSDEAREKKILAFLGG
jgi:hypothetical protein